MTTSTTLSEPVDQPREKPDLSSQPGAVVSERSSTPGRRTRGQLLWHGLRTVFDWIPLTLRGLLALVSLGLACWALGLGRNDKLLMALCCCGMVLLGLNSVLVFLSALWLRFRRRPKQLADLRLDAGASATTDLVLGRLHWNPLLRLQLRWLQPGGVSAALNVHNGKLTEEVVPEERAWSDQVERVVSVIDVLGLARINIRWGGPQVVRICPDRGGVKALALLPQWMAGDDQAHPDGRRAGDPMDMRGYGRGDPLKHILWKIWARTGRLLVRTPEQALSPCQKTLAYFVAGPSDEPSAGITRAVLESGWLGADFLFAADGGEATSCVPEAIEQLIRSVGRREQGGAGLGSFLAEGESRGSHACILFAPARTGPWLARVEEELRSHRGPFRVIIGIDVLVEGKPCSWLRRLLWQDEPSNVVRAAEVRGIRDHLEQTGTEVRLVNRNTGEVVILAETTETPKKGR
jgi:Protein of unknown function DUF58